MAFNPMALMKLRGMWDRFCGGHPRFRPFLAAAQKQLEEGTVIEISVTAPGRQPVQSNLKLTQSDMQTVRELESMFPNGNHSS